MLDVRLVRMYGEEETVPLEIQLVLSALYSSSHADSLLPGAQLNVRLFSVASKTYTLGVIQVTVLSQAETKMTLLRLEEIFLESEKL